MSLADCVASPEAISHEALSFVAKESACILAFLHAHRVIMRGLTPASLRIDCDGHLRLFGLDHAAECARGAGAPARFGPPPLAAYGTACAYLAPEVLAFLSTDPQVRMGAPTYGCESDWWSFGALLSTLLDKRPPHGELPTYADLLREAGPASSAAAPPPRVHRDKPTDPRALIRKLTLWTSSERLGAQLGASEVMAEPFFREVADWAAVDARTLPSPLKKTAWWRSGYKLYMVLDTDEAAGAGGGRRRPSLRSKLDLSSKSLLALGKAPPGSAAAAAGQGQGGWGGGGGGGGGRRTSLPKPPEAARRGSVQASTTPRQGRTSMVTFGGGGKEGNTGTAGAGAVPAARGPSAKLMADNSLGGGGDAAPGAAERVDGLDLDLTSAHAIAQEYLSRLSSQASMV